MHWKKHKNKVRTPPHVSRKDLARKIRNCDVCLTDFDDTDAPSQSRTIPLNDLKSGRALQPSFMMWGLKTFYNWLRNGKEAEGEAWKEYIDLFLQEARQRDALRRKLTAEEIREILYPGTQNLYDALEDAEKVYLTRNIAERIEPFADFLGFDLILPETFDKAVATEDFVKEENFRRYFFKGDSREDEEALEVLKFYEEVGEIEYVVSCHVTRDVSEPNGNFDITIPQDYTGLVELIS